MAPEEHARLILRIDKIPQTDKAAVIITLNFADELHVNTFGDSQRIVGDSQWIDLLIRKLKEGGDK